MLMRRARVRRKKEPTLFTGPRLEEGGKHEASVGFRTTRKEG